MLPKSRSELHGEKRGNEFHKLEVGSKEKPEGRTAPCYLLSTSERVLYLFGGRKSEGRSNELWKLELKEKKPLWELIHPKPGYLPSSLSGRGGGYFKEKGCLFFFGGFDFRG